MKLNIIVNGPLDVNTYIYGNYNEQCYVIDPGYDFNKIKNFIKQNHLGIKAILLTHGHYDHIGAVNELVKEFKCKVFIHPFDKAMIKNPKLNYSITYGKPYIIEGEVDDITLSNDENITIIHTPGHSKGSVCIYFKYENLLFSGDTLFFDGVGRTDLYSSSEKELKQSLASLFTLPDITLVYPGHDEFTTILKEKNNHE